MISIVLGEVNHYLSRRGTASAVKRCIDIVTFLRSSLQRTGDEGALSLSREARELIYKYRIAPEKVGVRSVNDLISLAYDCYSQYVTTWETQQLKLKDEIVKLRVVKHDKDLVNEVCRLGLALTISNDVLVELRKVADTFHRKWLIDIELTSLTATDVTKAQSN